MSRATETRAAKARRSYTPLSKLDAPPPKDGQRFRYIATHVLGQEAPANMSTRVREGWQPVRREEYPDWQGPVAADGTFSHGGLTLCKIDEDMAEARTVYYEEQARAQLVSVNRNLRNQQDARMPTLTNDSRSSTTGGARRVAVMDG